MCNPSELMVVMFFLFIAVLVCYSYLLHIFIHMMHAITMCRDETRLRFVSQYNTTLQRNAHNSRYQHYYNRLLINIQSAGRSVCIGLSTVQVAKQYRVQVLSTKSSLQSILYASRLISLLSQKESSDIIIVGITIITGSF